MKRLSPHYFSALAAGFSLITPAAHATLLFYEGFSADDYTEGALDGQPLVGAGYSAGGIWNTQSTFETGGLSFPDLATTDGFRILRSNGEVTANFNLTAGGPFGAAEVIGTNGLIGGAGFTGPIYFSVLGNRADTQGASFAGFNIYNGSDEGMGIGEVAGADYSWLQGGSNGAIGNPPTALATDETHFFVFKLNYDEVNPLTAKLWLDPNPLLGEDEQDVNISTDVANAKPVDGFDSFRLRGSRIWEFDEIRIGTTWEDVTPSALVSLPLIITAVSYENGVISLTWNSNSAETYTIKYSPNLIDWDLDVATGVSADAGETTTRSFDLSTNPATDGVEKLFFRIEVTP